MLPKSLRPLLPYFKKYYLSYVIGAVCVFLQNGAAVFFPLVIQHSIDDLNHGVERHKLLILAWQLLALSRSKEFFLSSPVRS